jgi:hypothetical protein
MPDITQFKSLGNCATIQFRLSTGCGKPITKLITRYVLFKRNCCKLTVALSWVAIPNTLCRGDIGLSKGEPFSSTYFFFKAPVHHHITTTFTFLSNPTWRRISNRSKPQSCRSYQFHDERWLSYGGKCEDHQGSLKCPSFWLSLATTSIEANVSLDSRIIKCSRSCKHQWKPPF